MVWAKIVAYKDEDTVKAVKTCLATYKVEEIWEKDIAQILGKFTNKDEFKVNLQQLKCSEI